MLLRGFTWLLVFQLLGTALNVLLLPFLPGPILGMVLLAIFLRLRGQVDKPLEQAANGLLKYLPLFLVPPATGIMMYGREVTADALAIFVSLTLSFVLVVPLVGRLMQALMVRSERPR